MILKNTMTFFRLRHKNKVANRKIKYLQKENKKLMDLRQNDKDKKLADLDSEILEYRQAKIKLHEFYSEVETCYMKSELQFDVAAKAAVIAKSQPLKLKEIGKQIADYEKKQPKKLRVV
jgi:hypothetical protein